MSGVLLIDNYDSFTYNLFQYLEELGARTIVVRSSDLSLEELVDIDPDKVIISPGPSRPENAELSMEAVRFFGGKVPIMGVCLGHQCVGATYGATIVQADEIRHGKTSPVKHDGQGLFEGIPQHFLAVRYHSLVIDRASLPKELEITAETDDGLIMGIKHKRFNVQGVQFHPESIYTESGKDILENFLEMDTAEMKRVDS